MMLGGVGFQVGLDEAQRKQEAARRAAAEAETAPAAAADVIDQLERLRVLLDEGVLTPEEFGLAKRKVLGQLSAEPGGSRPPRRAGEAWTC